MSTAQVSSARLLTRTNTLVIHGRAFREGAVVWCVEGRIRSKLKTLYSTNLVIAANAPSSLSVARALVAVENRGASQSKSISIKLTDRVEAEELLLAGTGVRIPFRLAFIANPFLKENGRIKHDPIVANPAFFRERVMQAVHDLFDRDPPEFFSEAHIRNGFRVGMFFPSELRATRIADVPEEFVLCMRRQVGSHFKIEASRRRVASFLQHHGTWADVAVVLSGASSAIPTAWFGTDNYARGGEAFEFDSRRYLHAFYSSLQGVIAFSRRPIRPFEFRHEFLHAASAFNSGQVLDEYDHSAPYAEPGVDRPFAVNKKFENAEPQFAIYKQRQYLGRSIGNGAARRFVPGPLDGHPCIMDRLSPMPRLDGLVRDFMRDRILAKLGRQF